MREYLKFYIDGQWVAPTEAKTADVINPATEEVSGKISLGTAADVEKAAAAARKAFGSWSQTSRETRLEVLQAIQAEYARRQTSWPKPSWRRWAPRPLSPTASTSS